MSYKQPTPADLKLEQACRDIDIDGVREALLQGARANFRDDTNCPMTFVVVGQYGPGEAGFEQRWRNMAEILSLLFEAGADPNDDWQEEDWATIQGGLELSINQLHWNSEANEAEEREAFLAIMEAWLSAGADPEVQMTVDGKLKGPIEHILWIRDNVLDPANAQEVDENQVNRTTASVIHLLGRYGADVSEKRLLKAGTEPGFVSKTLAAMELTLLENTTAPAQGRDKGGPRL